MGYPMTANFLTKIIKGNYEKYKKNSHRAWRRIHSRA